MPKKAISILIKVYNNAFQFLKQIHLKATSNQFYESIYLCINNSSTLFLVGNFLAQPLSQLNQTEIGVIENWLFDSQMKSPPVLSLPFHPSRHLRISLPVPFNPGYHLQLLHIPKQQKNCKFYCSKHWAYCNRRIHMCGYKKGGLGLRAARSNDVFTILQLFILLQHTLILKS